MNPYQMSSPRKAFAAVAFALTALTIGLGVIAPARMHSNPPDVRTLEALTVTAQAAIVAKRLRVDVVGVREPEFASVQMPAAPLKPRQEG